MKKTSIALTLAVLSSAAHADLSLRVVKDYSQAADAVHWNKPKNDQVPSSLLSDVRVADPLSPYAQLFPKHFLQHPDFVVCYVDCKLPDQFKLSRGELKTLSKAGKQSEWDLVEQSNVYYWLSQYLNFLEKNFNFRQKWDLQVYSNHIVKDENNGSVMKNNAFYNPLNNTLSFLPATKGLLYKLFGGKINRSGFDPSVVIHEASHFVFEHLYASPVNNEIKGLNEGFADYMANIFLDNPKVGLVMLQGKALRDSAQMMDSTGKLKTYAPRMEVHDLGERISLVLWESRKMAPNKTAFDAMVLESVQELSQNKFATVHDFKEIVLSRIKYDFAAQDAATAQAFWDLVLPGQATKVANTAFMSQPRRQKGYFGFNVRQIIGEELAETMGTGSEIKSNYTIIDTQPVTDKQTAILVASDNDDYTQTKPYWLVVDDARNNIIAGYTIDKKLVTDGEEAKEIEAIAQQVIGANDFVKDFTQKAKMFSQLANGQGELAAAYKANIVPISSETLTINGEKVVGSKLEMKLKRKLLANILTLGSLPEIDTIVLFAAPIDGPSALPVIGGQRVIGYRLLLKSGSGQEVILNKFKM